MKRIGKHLAVIMALMIGIAVFVPFNVPSAEARSEKYDLPSKVTNYEYKKGKWVKVSYSKLEYTKSGYLKTVRHSDGSSRSLKYSFQKGGKLKKITCPEGETILFNKKGRMTRYCLSNGRVFIKIRYKGNDVSGYWDRDEPAWFRFTYKKYPGGGIKKMRMKFPYEYYGDDPDSIIRFDKNGLLIKENCYTYKYSFDKKGRVRSVIEFYTDDGKSQKESKYVFSYSNAKSAKKRSRYTSLINAHIGSFNYGQNIAAGGGYMFAVDFIFPAS